MKNNQKGKKAKANLIEVQVPGGFVITEFNSEGMLQNSVPLNPGDDNSFYAETLFGIDFNGDNKLGLDISEIDEFQSFDDLDLGFDTFEGDYTNLTNLFVDAKGRLYFAPEDDPNNKQQLIQIYINERLRSQNQLGSLFIDFSKINFYINLCKDLKLSMTTNYSL